MKSSQFPRSTIPLFRIVFHHGRDSYTVVALDPDPAIATRVFRLSKQTRRHEVYIVRLTYQGPRCGCKGYKYRRHCKHIAMLRDARMLDPLENGDS